MISRIAEARPNAVHSRSAQRRPAGAEQTRTQLMRRPSLWLG